VANEERTGGSSSIRCAQDDKQKSNCKSKNEYGDLSTAAAKSAAFGRDDSIVGAAEEIPRSFAALRMKAI